MKVSFQSNLPSVASDQLNQSVMTVNYLMTFAWISQFHHTNKSHFKEAIWRSFVIRACVSAYFLRPLWVIPVQNSCVVDLAFTDRMKGNGKRWVILIKSSFPIFVKQTQCRTYFLFHAKRLHYSANCCNCERNSSISSPTLSFVHVTFTLLNINGICVCSLLLQSRLHYSSFLPFKLTDFLTYHSEEWEKVWNCAAVQAVWRKSIFYYCV